MSLTLYYHPLSSFCWKALIGLYELDLPFEKRLVDLGDPEDRARFASLWPLAKFPVLHDEARGRTVPESSIVLEYAARLAGSTRLWPSDPDAGLTCRLRDRLYDMYIHLPMQRLVAERMRPEGKQDPFGAEQARALIEAGYGLAESHLAEGPWAMGADFTLADCAAMPALHYANEVAPFVGRLPALTAYLERLRARPSVARVLREAEPYLHMFPR